MQQYYSYYHLLLLSVAAISFVILVRILRTGIKKNVNHLYVMSQGLVRNTSSKVNEIQDWVRQRLNQMYQPIKRQRQENRRKELTVENNQDFLYTEDQLMARLKFFIGICLALTLTGIVFVVLYSIIFITQPLNAISPIDQKFFEMIIPIATFLTGTLSGIMLAGNDKDLKAKALDAANRPTPVSPAPTTPSVSGPVFATPPVSPTIPKPSIPVPTPVTPLPTTTVSTDNGGVPPSDVVVGFNGKLAPPPAPQPEI